MTGARQKQQNVPVLIFPKVNMLRRGVDYIKTSSLFIFRFQECGSIEEVLANDPPQKRRPPSALRNLERFAVGTPYPEISESVRQPLREPTLTNKTLSLYWTEVGEAVLDVLVEGL